MINLGAVYKDEAGYYVVAYDIRSDIIEWHFFKRQDDIIDDRYVYKEYWRKAELLKYKNIRGVKI